MKTSAPGQSFIKSFESLRLTAYLPTPDDVLTIGWGHTGPDVTEGLSISLETAGALFYTDLAKAEQGVERLVKVPLTQGQFDALVSFAFNIGLDEDADTKAEGLGDSTLLRYLNEGQYDLAAEQILVWNKQDGKVVKGLSRRRQREFEMFVGTALA